MDCTGCIHKKICELWGKAEGQDASCYDDSCKETLADILGDECDLDRLRELVEADRDGRCFISPVKVGQTVLFVRDPKRHPENIVETCVEKVIHKRTGAYMKLACNSIER